MGASLFSLNFNLKCQSNEGMTERFIRCFAPEYIRPKSILMSVVGGPDFIEMEGCIDHPRKSDAHLSPEFLKHEKPFAGTTYTTLEAEDVFMSLPRDNSALHAHLTALRQAARSRTKNQNGAAEISLNFWGLTKTHYNDPHGRVKHAWALREKLVQFNNFVPLVTVALTEDCISGTHFDIHLSTRSRLWSKFTSSFDESAQDWIRKPNDGAEAANVVLACDALCQFFHNSPDAEMSWEFDQHHSPPLGELMVVELERRLGAPNIERKISDMPFYTVPSTTGESA